jgi:hypothetical protein
MESSRFRRANTEALAPSTAAWALEPCTEIVEIRRCRNVLGWQPSAREKDSHRRNNPWDIPQRERHLQLPPLSCCSLQHLFRNAPERHVLNTGLLPCGDVLNQQIPDFYRAHVNRRVGRALCPFHHFSLVDYYSCPLQSVLYGSSNVAQPQDDIARSHTTGLVFWSYDGSRLACPGKKELHRRALSPG